MEEILKPTGFYRAKTKAVIGLSAALADRFGGEVPRRMKDLVTLPGVGRKTANVVLGNAFGVPGITVDTHFGRLARQVRLDHRDRAGPGRGRCWLAVPPLGVDGPVAPADLARPPGMPRSPAGLRGLRAGAALPLLRPGSRRSEGRSQAGQDRAVLVTQDEAPAPPWLPELAAAIARTPVPPLLRPPAGVGRPSAILVLFGSAAPGPDGSDPDLLLIQRRPGLRRHGGQPAFPGGAIEPGDAGPVEAALREAAEEVGLDPSGVDVIGHGARAVHLPQRIPGHSGPRLVAPAGRGRAGRPRRGGRGGPGPHP